MKSESRNLVYEVLTDTRLVISCQNKSFPSDAEWDSWLTATRNLEHKTSDFRLLVVTEGGHPTKAQMERLRAANRTNPRTAILSPSLAYRFMASALTFVNPAIRCYSPAECEKAFDHIGLVLAERNRAQAVIERLQGQLTAR